MRMKFQKMNNEQGTFELLIPSTFYERLVGVRLFSYVPAHCGILFRSPCILHTLSLKEDIWMVPLDRELRPNGCVLRIEPNSIVHCRNSHWIAEFTQSPSLANATKNLVENRKYFRVKKIDGLLAARLFRLSSIVFLVVLFSFLSALGFASQKPLKLPVGETKEVSLDDAPKSLDISHPDVIDVQRVGMTNKILITALRSGTSRLTAHFHGAGSKTWNFQVGVTGSDTPAVPSLSSGSLVRIARDLQRRAGLETVLDNGRIVILGHLQNDAQFQSIVELCLGRDECLPRYTVSREAIQVQARYFRSLFQEIGQAGVSTEASVVGVNVRGSAASQDEADKIRLLLRSVLSRFNENIMTDKSSGHLIETQLTFFRMNISRLNALGISTVNKDQPAGSEISKGIIPNFLTQFRAGPNIKLQFPDVVVNALTQHGVLKQVARPSLVVASGGKGEIQSGGELLFQTTGQSQRFFSQNYGLTVTLQPNITGSGRISQKIDIKLSNPQSLANPHAISAMQQSVMSTELSSLPDEQILLTKIDLQMSGKAVSKVPILGHLPIIGELFKSRDLRSEDTELWIALKNSLAVSQLPDFSQTEKKTESATPEAQWLD